MYMHLRLNASSSTCLLRFMQYISHREHVALHVPCCPQHFIQDVMQQNAAVVASTSRHLRGSAYCVIHAHVEAA